MAERVRNVRLLLAYDGTDYVGWQVQPNGESVQSVVVEAIRRLTGEEVKLIAAGRTDSGVHAVGQVANFHTESTIPAAKMRRGLQNYLPDAVVVRRVDDVPEDFHSTYDAVRKRYRYVIRNDRVKDPFTRRYAWRFWGDLDVPAMHEAAQVLVGTHDFRCFESQWPNKATSVRTIEEAVVQRRAGWDVWDAGERGASAPCSGDLRANVDQPIAPTGGSRPPLADGPYITFDVVADGFLYNMVRAIMGTLIKVGRGKWTADDVARIVAEGDRGRAGETAPACGLFLVRVDYEEMNRGGAEIQRDEREGAPVNRDKALDELFERVVADFGHGAFDSSRYVFEQITRAPDGCDLKPVPLPDALSAFHGESACLLLDPHPKNAGFALEAAKLLERASSRSVLGTVNDFAVVLELADCDMYLVRPNGQLLLVATHEDTFDEEGRRIVHIVVPL